MEENIIMMLMLYYRLGMMPRLCLPRNVRIRMERLPKARNVTKSRRNSMIRLELSPLLMPTTSRREDYVVVQPLVTKRADGTRHLFVCCLDIRIIGWSLPFSVILSLFKRREGADLGSYDES